MEKESNLHRPEQHGSQDELFPGNFIKPSAFDERGELKEFDVYLDEHTKREAALTSLVDSFNNFEARSQDRKNPYPKNQEKEKLEPTIEDLPVLEDLQEEIITRIKADESNENDARSLIEVSKAVKSLQMEKEGWNGDGTKGMSELLSRFEGGKKTQESELTRNVSLLSKDEVNQPDEPEIKSENHIRNDAEHEPKEQDESSENISEYNESLSADEQEVNKKAKSVRVELKPGGKIVGPLRVKLDKEGIRINDDSAPELPKVQLSKPGSVRAVGAVAEASQNKPNDELEDELDASAIRKAVNDMLGKNADEKSSKEAVYASNADSAAILSKQPNNLEPRVTPRKNRLIDRLKEILHTEPTGAVIFERREARINKEGRIEFVQTREQNISTDLEDTKFNKHIRTVMALGAISVIGLGIGAVVSHAQVSHNWAKENLEKVDTSFKSGKDMQKTKKTFKKSNKGNSQTKPSKSEIAAINRAIFSRN